MKMQRLIKGKLLKISGNTILWNLIYFQSQTIMYKFIVDKASRLTFVLIQFVSVSECANKKNSSGLGTN